MAETVSDIFVIGGGINGCGIARDAAGRGLSVTLAEMGDLAQATSSASTKLFHGGLRYLEYFEVRLVREALIERETLLRAMPHISWPMRFVLPYHKDMRFETETPASKLLSLVMPWMKGRRPGLDDPAGAVHVRHPGRARDPAGHEDGGSADRSGGGAAEGPSSKGVRIFRLLGRGFAARGAQCPRRGLAGRAGPGAHQRVVSAERAADHWTVTVEDVDTGARSSTARRCW
jgi:glycerol-3-phosphate dehydrogenase